LASMQQRRAHACYLCGQFDEALEAQHAALDLYRKLDDRRRMGESMWSLSRLFRYVGRGPEALESAQEAIRILEQLPAGPELALAYCNLSHLYVNSEDADEAKLWAHRALAIAEKLGHVEARVYAEINLAVVEYLATQSPALVDEFERIFRLAKEHGLNEHAGRALLHLTWWSPRFKSYDVADRYYDSGLDFSIERGLDLWRHYMLAYRARCEMACWRARSGAQKLLTGQVPQPYALELQGKARQAAEQWLRLGCTYEAAMSLASSVDEDDLRESLRQFQLLGARPAAAIVSRRL